MRTTPLKGAFVVAGAAALALAGCTPDDSATSGESGTASGDANTYSTREVTDGTTTFTVVDNPNNGTTLSFGSEGAFALLEEKDGDFTYAFKDMNGNGKLDTWEDWREDSQTRADDLAGQLSKEQIAGLTLFSSHQRSPEDGLTDDQKGFLTDGHVRNVLNAGGNVVEDQVTWANEMQQFVETLATDDEPYIPVNFSSDPRSSVEDAGFAEAGTTVSQWPSNLGMAATFDPEKVEQMAELISAEYRALGIQTALGPQIDLVTDPRWSRNSGTFGEDVDLASSMAHAYVTGMQTSLDDEGNDIGFGPDSVQAEIKHFPGDGAGEGGREAHHDYGKYAVYPGGNEMGSVPIFEAALDAAQVMTSYSIGVAADGTPAFGVLRGTAYDKAKVDILREDNSYNGVIVTDWMVTKSATDEGATPGINTAWGVADMPINERYFEILKSGVDMFGGIDDVTPVLAAYDLWQEAFEKGDVDVDAETRFAQTASRSLNMVFNTGAYENPYLDLDNSKSVVGSEERMQAGETAQLDSVVMVKNTNSAIAATSAEDWSNKTVYIPQSYDRGRASMRGEAEYTQGPNIDLDVAGQYFGKVVTDEVELDGNGEVVKYTTPDLSDVDLVLVGMRQPDTGPGFDSESSQYLPISLQYRPYTADGENVRKTSIAGDKLEDGTQENRSYFGNSTTASNEADLDSFERVVKAVEDSGKDIPVITVLKIDDTIIPTEFEAASDAIIVGLGVTDEALIQVALGIHEPSGRLPIGFPDSMDSVEASFEDVPKDQGAYTDSQGNVYEFGFGLDFSGVISGK